MFAMVIRSIYNIAILQVSVALHGGGQGENSQPGGVTALISFQTRWGKGPLSHLAPQ